MGKGAGEDEDEFAVRCAACDQREDALDNLSRRRFKINTACGHYFCDTCIQREFARKTRGAFRCPACLKMGREREVLRQSLETKTLEQLVVEMDTKWREKVMEVFGKREEEFASEEEYNDYIEKREDLIYTLANRLTLDEEEVVKAQAALEAERKRNEAAVAKYKARREEERRKLEKAVEAADRKWAEAVRLAQERERLEGERRKDFRRQIQQRNLGERDSVTIRLDEPIVVERGAAMDEEDDDLMELTGRKPVNMPEGAGGPMGGASIFHTNLRVIVGDQPRIVENPNPPRRELDREMVAKASGWPLQLRYKRCWQEAIASLFISSTEARTRLAKTFYKASD